jgi:hypothetical protein
MLKGDEKLPVSENKVFMKVCKTKKKEMKNTKSLQDKGHLNSNSILS